jgi:hypothetical protein
MKLKTAIAAVAATLAMCLPGHAVTILPGYEIDGQVWTGDGQGTTLHLTPINGPGQFSLEEASHLVHAGASVGLTPAPLLTASAASSQGPNLPLGQASATVHLRLLA